MIITRNTIDPRMTIEEHGIIYTYDDFVLMLDKWHAFFDHLGLKAGDKYISDSKLTLEQITLFIAGAERGLVFYAIPFHRWNIYGQSTKWKEAGVKIIFSSVVLTDGGESVISVAYNESMYDFEPVIPTFGSTPDSPVITGVTSGTTGAPKSHTHTHRSLRVTADYAGKRFYKHTDLVLNVIPINHTAVLSQCILPALMAGSKNLYHEYVGHTLLDTMLERKPNKMTIFFVALVHRLQVSPKWRECNLEFLEEVITTGEVLRADEMAKVLLIEKGVKKLINIYGASEVGMLAALELTKDTLESCFSEDKYPLIGEPYPHLELKLENGEFYVKTPGIAPDIATENGWFSTRDRGMILNGKTYILGRRMRTVRINDVLVNLEHLSYTLNNFTKNDKKVIKESYCFERDQKLYAIIDLVEDVEVTIEELSDFVSIQQQHLCALSGFVVGKRIVKPGSIKYTWDTNVEIPKHQQLDNNPTPFLNMDLSEVEERYQRLKKSQNNFRARLNERLGVHEDGSTIVTP